VTKIILSLACLVMTPLLIAGCGSSTAANPLDGGTHSGSLCTVTLTGGVASTHSCALSFAYDGTLTATDFSLTTTHIDPATVPNLTASIQIAGAPATGPVQSTDPSVLQGYLAVSAQNATDAWSADAESTNTAATGSFTLTITALGTAISAGGSSYYTNTHGSLDATLVPVTSGQTSPDIVAHAEF